MCVKDAPHLCRLMFNCAVVKRTLCAMSLLLCCTLRADSSPPASSLCARQGDTSQSRLIPLLLSRGREERREEGFFWGGILTRRRKLVEPYISGYAWDYFFWITVSPSNETAGAHLEGTGTGEVLRLCVWRGLDRKAVSEGGEKGGKLQSVQQHQQHQHQQQHHHPGPGGSTHAAASPPQCAVRPLWC